MFQWEAIVKRRLNHDIVNISSRDTAGKLKVVESYHPISIWVIRIQLKGGQKDDFDHKSRHVVTRVDNKCR